MAHKFKIGDRVVVTGGGIRNGWQAVVVPSFNWQKEVGAYKPVPSGYVYLRAVSDRYGEPKDELFTMPKNYIALAEKTKKRPAIEKLDQFTRAYLEAALWSSMDESTPSGGYPLDRNYGISDIHVDTLAKMIEDALRFQNENADDIGSRGSEAGHDFWLTRNHHGAGYWDGDWDEPAATRLTDAAKAYGDFNLYVGNDGMIDGSEG